MIEGLLILLCLLPMISIVLASVQYGISPMPSHHSVSRHLQDLIPEEHNSLFYDFGSGWGQVAYRVAKKNPQMTVIGIEGSWIPFLFSKFYFRQPNLSFKRKDFRTMDISKDSVVFCYLYPEAMRHIEQWDALNHCWVISNTFQMFTRKSSDQRTLDDAHRSSLMLYPPVDSLRSNWYPGHHSQ